MCESELPLPSTPPQSTPHFQRHSSDASIRYCPRLIQRMQTDTCFRCHRQGHWARDCPLNSPISKSHSPIAENSGFPKIYCRCGHGICEVKTAKTDRNYGRKYYACPIKMGKRCTNTNVVKWCDEPIDESYLRPPRYTYPTCSCGAGVCRKEKERSAPNEGRYFFACPIPKDHGACNFRMWEDELLGTPNIASVRQSCQTTLHDYWECKLNMNDLGKEVDSLLGHSNRMKTAGNSEYSLAMDVSELPEGADAAPKEVQIEKSDLDETTGLSSPLDHAGFPKFEADDDLEDIARINSVSWEAIGEKAQSLSTPSTICSRQRSQRTLLDYWECKKVVKNNINDLGKDGDSLLCHSKRIKRTVESEYSSVMAVSELPEGEDAVPEERRDHDDTTEFSTLPNHVGFPDFEADDDPEDIAIISSVSWEAIEGKARSISQLSTPSRIHYRQREFQRQIFTVANASFGDPCPMGWLGRLVFYHPTLSLELPQPVPFFCCVFPSFDAIVVPTQESNHDGLCGESSQLLISNPGQCEQLSTNRHTEVSGDIVSPNTSPGSESKPTSKPKKESKMALILQKGLLRELETLNTLDYDYMRETAEVTFDLLNRCSVDHKQFSEHVWEFICSATSLAEIENSIQNDLPPEEHIQRYEEEKVRRTNIHNNYVKTKASLEVSQQHSQSLREEASRLKALLQGVTDQLTVCELETEKMETQLREINASMMEAEESLKIAAEQAGTARKLITEREAKRIAAKTALEKAKLEIGN